MIQYLKLRFRNENNPPTTIRASNGTTLDLNGPENDGFEESFLGGKFCIGFQGFWETNKPLL